MTKARKNPTWFFLLIIAGAAVLLAILFFGLGPNANSNSLNEETVIEETEELEEVIEEVVEVPEEPGDRSMVEIEGDEQVDLVETEGILTQQFESGGRVTSATEDFEGIMRESLGVYEEEEVTVDGKEGVLAFGRSAKDGTIIAAIWIKEGGYIYEFDGDETFLDAVQETATFTTNP